MCLSAKWYFFCNAEQQNQAKTIAINYSWHLLSIFSCPLTLFASFIMEAKPHLDSRGLLFIA